jgi:integrase/recombinase XerC
LVRLDLADIDREARTLAIRRRGAQEQRGALSAPTLAALESWLELRARIAPANETAVFVGLSGRRSKGRRIAAPALLPRHSPG